MSFVPSFALSRPVRFVPAILLALSLPAAAQEQDFFQGVDIVDSDPSQAALFVGDDSALSGSVCIGSACSDFEDFDVQTTLKLKSTLLRLEFVDSNNAVSSEPSNDWTLEANDLNAGGMARFSIADATAGTLPFTIEAAAPDTTMWLDNTGRVGLGTMFPQSRLHIAGSVGPSIRLEQQGSGLLQPRIWRLFGQNSFGLSDETAGTTPLRIAATAPDDAFRIAVDGSAGLGTATPAAPLHVSRNDGSASVLVENTGGDPGVARELFKLSNNGGSYFTFENTAAGTTWFFTHENAAPNRFIISDAVPDGPEFSLTAGGDVIIPGNFISGATTLNVPDYVFADDYALRPLSEVQAFITQNRHLPDVPSAAEIAAQGLDMTGMQMALLKKVEELTLYTLALEAARAEQAEELAQLRGMQNKLNQLEALSARIEALEQ